MQFKCSRPESINKFRLKYALTFCTFVRKILGKRQFTFTHRLGTNEDTPGYSPPTTVSNTTLITDIIKLLLNKCARFRQNHTWHSPLKPGQENQTYASSFPFSSDVTLSFCSFSFDWHPMARYWATSGWTRLSICVLLDGSISSLCSAKCASAVSAALCWLVNEHYTIKSHPACLRVGGRGAGLVTHAEWAPLPLASKVEFPQVYALIKQLVWSVESLSGGRANEMRSSSYIFIIITLIWGCHVITDSSLLTYTFPLSHIKSH